MQMIYEHYFTELVIEFVWIQLGLIDLICS